MLTSDEDLLGKKVLVVDDEVRNIFALGSVLEHHGMTVATAQTGREAIAILEQSADTAIVLMDNMMPEMDGSCGSGCIVERSGGVRCPVAWDVLRVVHVHRLGPKNVELFVKWLDRKSEAAAPSCKRNPASPLHPCCQLIHARPLHGFSVWTSFPPSSTKTSLLHWAGLPMRLCAASLSK